MKDFLIKPELEVNSPGKDHVSINLRRSIVHPGFEVDCESFQGEVHYRFCDRSQWDKGSWDEEPDGVFWETRAGVPCFVRRNQEIGTWCGYVAIPAGHPAIRDKRTDELEVHGGITFRGDSEFFTAFGFEVPLGFQWLGFDCFHAFDGSPLAILSASREQGKNLEGGYRTLGFARRECEELARQLGAMMKRGPDETYSRR